MKVNITIPDEIISFLKEKNLNDEQIIHMFIMWMQYTVFDYGWDTPKDQFAYWLEDFGQDYLDELLEESDVPMNISTEIKFR